MASVTATINVNVNAAAAQAQLAALQKTAAAASKSAVSGSTAASTAYAMQARRIGENLAKTGMFTTSMGAMRTQTGLLTKEFDRGSTSMRSYFANRGKSAAMDKLAAERVKTLQTSYAALGKEVNGTQQTMAMRPNHTIKQLGADMMFAQQRALLARRNLKMFGDHLVNVGKNTQWAGRQMTVGMSVPIAIAAAGAVKSFSDIEKASISFKRVYGDATTTAGEKTEALGQIFDGVSREYTKYGIAASDSLEVAAKAAATGAQGKDLMAATEQTLRLATLGQMDYDTALESTIATQSIFKTSAEDLPKAIDFLNAAENQTILSMEDMATAIPRTGAAMKVAGGDVQDLAVLMGALRVGGINASMGANALKTGISKILKPTSTATDYVKDFGINLDKIGKDNKGNVIGMFEDLQKQTSKLGKQDQIKVLSSIFGLHQYPKIAAMMANLGDKQVLELKKLSKASAGELAKMSETELSQIEDSPLTKVKKAIEDIKIAAAPVGEAVMTGLAPILSGLGSFISMVSNNDFLKWGTVIAAGAAAAVGPIVMLVGLLGNFAGYMVKAAQGAASFGRMLAKPFGGKGNVAWMSSAQLEASTAAKALGSSANSAAAGLNTEAAAARALTAALQQLAAASSGAAAGNAKLMGAGLGGRASAAQVRAAKAPPGYIPGVAGLPMGAQGSRGTVAAETVAQPARSAPMPMAVPQPKAAQQTSVPLDEQYVAPVPSSPIAEPATRRKTSRPPQSLPKYLQGLSEGKGSFKNGLVTGVLGEFNDENGPRQTARSWRLGSTTGHMGAYSLMMQPMGMGTGERARGIAEAAYRQAQEKFYALEQAGNAVMTHEQGSQIYIDAFEDQIRRTGDQDLIRRFEQLKRPMWAQSAGGRGSGRKALHGSMTGMRQATAFAGLDDDYKSWIDLESQSRFGENKAIKGGHGEFGKVDLRSPEAALLRGQLAKYGIDVDQLLGGQVAQAQQESKVIQEKQQVLDQEQAATKEAKKSVAKTKSQSAKTQSLVEQSGTKRLEAAKASVATAKQEVANAEEASKKAKAEQAKYTDKKWVGTDEKKQAGNAASSATRKLNNAMASRDAALAEQAKAERLAAVQQRRADRIAGGGQSAYGRSQFAKPKPSTDLLPYKPPVARPQAPAQTSGGFVVGPNGTAMTQEEFKRQSAAVDKANKNAPYQRGWGMSAKPAANPWAMMGLGGTSPSESQLKQWRQQHLPPAKQGLPGGLKYAPGVDSKTGGAYAGLGAAVEEETKKRKGMSRVLSSMGGKMMAAGMATSMITSSMQMMGKEIPPFVHAIGPAAMGVGALSEFAPALTALANPVGAAVAGITAAAAGFTLVGKMTNDHAWNLGQDMGNFRVATVDATKGFEEVYGRTSYFSKAQRDWAQKVDSDIKDADISKAKQYAATEAGGKLKEDFGKALGEMGSDQAIAGLTNNMASQILQGVMTATEAKALAGEVGGDVAARGVSAQLNEMIGKNGKILKSDPFSVAGTMLNKNLDMIHSLRRGYADDIRQQAVEARQPPSYASGTDRGFRGTGVAKPEDIPEEMNPSTLRQRSESAAIWGATIQQAYMSRYAAEERLKLLNKKRKEAVAKLDGMEKGTEEYKDQQKAVDNLTASVEKGRKSRGEYIKATNEAMKNAKGVFNSMAPKGKGGTEEQKQMVNSSMQRLQKQYEDQGKGLTFDAGRSVVDSMDDWGNKYATLLDLQSGLDMEALLQMRTSSQDVGQLQTAMTNMREGGVSPQGMNDFAASLSGMTDVKGADGLNVAQKFMGQIATASPKAAKAVSNVADSFSNLKKGTQANLTKDPEAISKILGVGTAKEAAQIEKRMQAYEEMPKRLRKAGNFANENISTNQMRNWKDNRGVFTDPNRAQPGQPQQGQPQQPRPQYGGLRDWQRNPTAVGTGFGGLQPRSPFAGVGGNANILTADQRRDMSGQRLGWGLGKFMTPFPFAGGAAAAQPKPPVPQRPLGTGIGGTAQVGQDPLLKQKTAKIKTEFVTDGKDPAAKMKDKKIKVKTEMEEPKKKLRAEKEKIKIKTEMEEPKKKLKAAKEKMKIKTELEEPKKKIKSPNQKVKIKTEFEKPKKPPQAKGMKVKIKTELQKPSKPPAVKGMKVQLQSKLKTPPKPKPPGGAVQLNSKLKPPPLPKPPGGAVMLQGKFGPVPPPEPPAAVEVPTEPAPLPAPNYAGGTVSNIPVSPAGLPAPPYVGGSVGPIPVTPGGLSTPAYVGGVVTIPTRAAPIKAEGGLFPYASGGWHKTGGGRVDGKGGPTDDKINARLSNGEFVMRAKAVQKYGVAVMRKINNLQFANGGIVPGYKKGDVHGKVKSSKKDDKDQKEKDEKNPLKKAEKESRHDAKSARRIAKMVKKQFMRADKMGREDVVTAIGSAGIKAGNKNIKKASKLIKKLTKDNKELNSREARRVAKAVGGGKKAQKKFKNELMANRSRGEMGREGAAIVERIRNSDKPWVLAKKYLKHPGKAAKIAKRDVKTQNKTDKEDQQKANVDEKRQRKLDWKNRKFTQDLDFKYEIKERKEYQKNLGKIQNVMLKHKSAAEIGIMKDFSAEQVAAFLRLNGQQQAFILGIYKYIKGQEMMISQRHLTQTSRQKLAWSNWANVQNYKLLQNLSEEELQGMEGLVGNQLWEFLALKDEQIKNEEKIQQKYADLEMIDTQNKARDMANAKAWWSGMANDQNYKVFEALSAEEVEMFGRMGWAQAVAYINTKKQQMDAEEALANKFAALGMIADAKLQQDRLNQRLWIAAANNGEELKIMKDLSDEELKALNYMLPAQQQEFLRLKREAYAKQKSLEATYMLRDLQAMNEIVQSNFANVAQARGWFGQSGARIIAGLSDEEIDLYNRLDANGKRAFVQARKLQETQAKALEILADPAAGLQELAEKLTEQAIFNTLGKTKAQVDADVGMANFVMDQLNRKAELEQREIDDINEMYDDQEKALAKIEDHQNQIAQIEKGRLSVAQAISSGDVAAAARAVQEAKQQEAAMAREQMKKAIEEQKTKIIEQREDRIKEYNDQAEAIADFVWDLQNQVTLIEARAAKAYADQIAPYSVAGLAQQIEDLRAAMSLAGFGAGLGNVPKYVPDAEKYAGNLEQMPRITDNITFNIDGAKDPTATANEVIRVLNYYESQGVRATVIR